MRTKFTLLLALCALLVPVASAQAGPIPVAVYAFSTPGDITAFTAASTGKCTKKWQDQMMMRVTLGEGVNSCILQTSVVADSSDVAPDQIISATINAGPGGTPKLQKKAYEGVVLRRNDTSGYELRVLPNAQKWQVLRDPKGPAPVAILASGTGKFIKTGAKPNAISLKAFDFGGADTQLTASINGRSVLSQIDSGMDQPDGRRNGVSIGVKGTGAGTGISGVFDNVAIQVPNPF